jgi:hypothetical protein
LSTWFNAVVDDWSKVVDCLSYFEKEFEEARQECRIHKSLEKSSQLLPGITEHRFNQLQELEAILEYLNIELRKLRSQTFRKYIEKYDRALTSRDAEKYIDGEDDVVNMMHLINQFSLIRNKYLGIMKGLESKSFQLNNISRLRVAGLEDIEL